MRLAWCLFYALPLLAQTGVGRFTDLLEWTLNVHLTEQEKAELARQTIDEKTASNLVQVRGMVNALPEDQRQQVRTTVEQSFLKTLHEKPEHPIARLLLPAYERAHSTQFNTGVPKLEGTWSKTTASTTTFVDRATGASAAPSGDGSTYHFLPGGQFRSENVIQSTLYSCTATAVFVESGSYTVNGNQISLRTAAGDMRSRSTCQRDSNYDKPLPLKVYTFTWRLARDQYGEMLCLGNPGKTDSCMYRQ